MAERFTQRSIVFAHGFSLPGVEGLQPAGAYEVETLDEQIDGLSFVAYRRISTTIALHGATAATMSRQVTSIDPADLADAIERDTQTAGATAK